jgi:hypothetical protein
MYRQGDILIVPTNEKIDGHELPRDDKGRVVLALGEATGHAHAIHSNQAKLFRSVAGSEERMFLKVDGLQAVNLVHEEHALISLKPGGYKVIRQREYSAEEIRRVAD